jgi:3-hydroxyanthranilate 3,4-dioxygenase
MTLPFNIFKWVQENRHLLKPPVGNKQLFAGKDFIVMAVGGPNARTDFHYNETEEFFFQLEGTITVNIQQDGQRKAIAVHEGDVFLLPARTPHNPVRPAGTVGLVIEKVRTAGQEDGLLWYCDNCNALLFEKHFKLKNIETDFLEVFKEFNRSKDLRTCPECSQVAPADPRYL